MTSKLCSKKEMTLARNEALSVRWIVPPPDARLEHDVFSTTTAVMIISNHQLPFVCCELHMAPTTAVSHISTTVRVVDTNDRVPPTNCSLASSIKNGYDVQRYLSTPGNKGLFFVLAAASPGQLNTYVKWCFLLYVYIFYL